MVRIWSPKYKFDKGLEIDFRKDSIAQKHSKVPVNAQAEGSNVKQPEFEDGNAMVGLIEMCTWLRGIMRRIDFPHLSMISVIL